MQLSFSLAPTRVVFSPLPWKILISRILLSRICRIFPRKTEERRNATVYAVNCPCWRFTAVHSGGNGQEGSPTLKRKTRDEKRASRAALNVGTAQSKQPDKGRRNFPWRNAWRFSAARTNAGKMKADVAPPNPDRISTRCKHIFRQWQFQPAVTHVNNGHAAQQARVLSPTAATIAFFLSLSLSLSLFFYIHIQSVYVI